MFKKIILAAVFAMLPMFAASAQTVKIGLVNTDDVMQAMPETKEAQTKLADTSKKYEDEYAKLGEEMKRLYDELNAMPESELAAVRERKVRDFQDFQTKMQQFEQSAQQDLQRLQQELMAPISQKINAAVESVGKENGFSYIQNYVPGLTLYYAAPVEDVTNLVKAKLGIK